MSALIPIPRYPITPAQEEAEQIRKVRVKSVLHVNDSWRYGPVQPVRGL